MSSDPLPVQELLAQVRYLTFAELLQGLDPSDDRPLYIPVGALTEASRINGKTPVAIAPILADEHEEAVLDTALREKDLRPWMLVFQASDAWQSYRSWHPTFPHTAAAAWRDRKSVV